MMNKINVTQILSKNCGGYGAWMDNTLNSPAPGEGLWRGFQLGGGSGGGMGGIRRRKYRKSRKFHKSQKNKKRHQKKTMRK